jgi:hypothetical protein
MGLLCLLTGSGGAQTAQQWAGCQLALVKLVEQHRQSLLGSHVSGGIYRPTGLLTGGCHDKRRARLAELISRCCDQIIRLRVKSGFEAPGTQGSCHESIVRLAYGMVNVGQCKFVGELSSVDHFHGRAHLEECLFGD